MAILTDENGIGYSNGYKVRLTGRRDNKTYSIILVEFVYLEGPHKGEKFWKPGQ